ncbi:hypothetical protein K503DRAFT_802064 [Rhizopogon vinicolor AM-OR11-026]|uniref:Uncharacterized protein n=1 Tax=Rhizopogon vinicolor AM-OR11-026 TaxID=1314800 RepID=A0A1B7MV28_9AGAM|nr:hypothetical protein K503DRAFT_802064 [Rhizopogon vinicolor AM-OR11-026]
MFAVSLPHHDPGQNKDTSFVMDGRRANAPQCLNINATMSHVMRASMTHLLSPNSGYSHSPVSPPSGSPLSPAPNITPTTGQFLKTPLSSPRTMARGQLHSPSPNEKHVPLSLSPTNIHIVTLSRTPSPISNHFTRHLSGETVNQSPFSAVPVRLPFLDTFDKAPVNGGGDDDSDEERPMSPSTNSDAGLAHVHDSDDTPVVMPLDIRKSSALSSTNKVKFSIVEGGQPSSPVQKPPSRKASTSPATSYSTSQTANTGPSRARSASSTTHTTMRSSGALERAMETLIEEGASVPALASGSVLASLPGIPGRVVSGKPNQSNTVPGPVSPEHRPPKLPAPSYTSPHHPHIHSERVGVTGEVARVRERERWKWKADLDERRIRMNDGNVMCEWCWKNMYLPKCRRCNLSIEKQAVSSSDGQLKGKHHRDYFIATFVRNRSQTRNSTFLMRHRYAHTIIMKRTTPCARPSHAGSLSRARAQ